MKTHNHKSKSPDRIQIPFGLGGELDCEKPPKKYLDQVKQNYAETSMLIKFWKWLGRHFKKLQGGVE